MADLLIVDDDCDVAELLGEALAHLGHQVRIAHDGMEGMRALAVRAPDAVLLDVEMPMLDGPGMACEMIVRDCGLEAIPIVLLSGIVDLDQVAARVGTPYFLGKPYTLGAVTALCARALSERTPPVPSCGQAS
ncbi:MAG TPA: response regulator [Kofleriaceae bacterium]|jgi:CheY-like chemotaxis protein|nr:response regulator [Kofleriaceae bacterium]